VGADVLIAGQGLAGTLLAWALERAGISFAVADAGPARAATMAAAGIINPITGRRLVQSWRIDTLRPAAAAVFRELEAALGVPLWREMRVRRFFADAREREIFAVKQARGELAPYAGESDDTGFWIHGAARVEMAALLTAARARWRAAGRLREAVTDLDAVASQYEWVIDCTGVAATEREEFRFLPWEFSKGEVLTIAVAGLASDEILNRRRWITPVGEGSAWVGATHEPGVRDSRPGEAARVALEENARELLGGRDFAVTGQRAGVRVNLPDKRPVAGCHPERARLGLINGLGSKGGLWAPFLARQWAEHLTAGRAFDAEIGVERFGR
jgi:glycine/D-amino acid oxidase-like deaminating enzyme